MARQPGENLNPRRTSIGNLLHNLGYLASGKRVLVTIDSELASARHVTDVGTGDVSLEEVVEMGLKQAPLTVADAGQFEEHYGLEPGTLWNRGGRTRDFDATRPLPPFSTPVDTATHEAL